MRDDFCRWNNGAFELEAGPEGASCKPTTGLSLAGRVRELTSGTIAGLDRAMTTPRIPWTLEL